VNLSLMAILILPMLVSVGVAVHAWFQRPNRNAFAMFVFMAVTSAYLGFYLFQVASNELVMARFWMLVALPWSLLMGTGWFVLALHVAGYERVMHRVHYMLLSVIPIIGTLLGWTNRFHGLYGRDFHMETEGFYHLLIFQHGPAYWLNAGFIAVMIIAGLIVMIQTIIRRSRSNPWQTAWISVAVLIPALTYILMLSGYSPIPGVNLTPFSFSVAGLALAASLFHYNFLEVAPLARTTIFKNIEVGILVLDTENSVADANPAALRMLAPLSEVIIGQHIQHIFPKHTFQLQKKGELVLDREIYVDRSDGPAVLEVELSPLLDKTGKLGGRLVNLHDITERRQVSQALRTSEENLSAILNSSTNSITLVDPHQRVILANPVARQRALNLCQRDIRTGDPIKDFIRPDNHADFDARFNRALTGEVVSSELRIDETTEDGKTGVWYELLNYPVYTSDNELLGISLTATSIDDRKTTETMLSESERRFRNYFEQGLVGMGVSSPDKIWIEVNNRLCEILGYSRQELLSTSWLDFTHPDDRDPNSYSYNRLIAGEIGDYTYEKRYIHKTGRDVYCLVTVRPYHLEGGTIDHTLAIVEDITPTKEALEKLRQSKEYAEQLFRVAPSGIFTVDTDCIVTTMNARAAEITGYQPEEVIGKHCNLFTRAPCGDHCGLYEYASPTRAITGAECVIETKDGRMRTILKNAEQLVDRNGIVVGGIESIEDITESKQAQEALATERQKLAYVIEGTNAGVWEWNLQTGESIVNQRWAEMIGFTLEEINLAFQRSVDVWTEHIHPDDLKKSYALMDKHFIGESDYYECELRIRHKNGSWVWVLDRGKVATWTEDGKPITMFGTHQDITERKLIEKSEREQRRLAETLREVGLALTTQLDPDAVLDALMEQINRIVPYDSINIMLLEDGHLKVNRQKGYEQFGADSATNAVEAHIDDLHYFKVMLASRLPAVVRDTIKDPDWVVIEASQHVKSWLGAPIIVRGELIGFLSIDKAESGFYSAKHVERIKPLAAHAGLAIENARLHSETEYQATHDGLTGLPNRVLLIDRLHHALRVAHRNNDRVAVLFIDLDGFKAINDTHGHDVGDWLLQEVARRLKESIRESDTVARIGGDEFTIILEKLSMDDGSFIVAEKVRAAVAEPYMWEETEMGVSASIGIACYPVHGRNAEILLKMADQAMYQAKHLGKNKIVIST
jgi:diguanylate cyclase (GGDEF)-like protein/PAS domain S-box-containing protein